MSNAITAPQHASPAVQATSAVDMVNALLEGGATPEIIREFVALQQNVERFAWEREERQARIDFDDALNRVQSKISTVLATRQSDKGKYANYADLDNVARPLYTTEGFSLSYGEADCPTAGKTRFVAYLRRGGITREYFKDMTASTKGPKGNDVLTPIHAEASADSYAKRYLLKDIFNMSTAISLDDDDGNGGMPNWLPDHLIGIDEAEEVDTLKERFQSAYKVAQSSGDRKAMGEIIFRHDKRKAFLKGATK